MYFWDWTLSHSFSNLKPILAINVSSPAVGGIEGI